MAKKPERAKATERAKIYSIALPTKRQDIHQRYLKVSKAVQEKFKMGKIIPEFLVDALEAEEARGFEGLKKYI